MSLIRQYSIEMHYRNDSSKDPYLLTLPGCTSSCPLEKFSELVSPIITESWSKECGNKDKTKGSVTALYFLCKIYQGLQTLNLSCAWTFTCTVRLMHLNFWHMYHVLRMPQLPVYTYSTADPCRYSSCLPWTTDSWQPLPNSSLPSWILFPGGKWGSRQYLPLSISPGISPFLHLLSVLPIPDETPVCINYTCNVTLALWKPSSKILSCTGNYLRVFRI